MSEFLRLSIAGRIPAYLDRRVADVNTLRLALAANDLPRIQTIAHNMKGTGSSYGFCAITEIGEQMEAAAKSSDRPGIAACLDQLGAYLDRVRPADAELPASAGNQSRNTVC